MSDKKLNVTLKAAAGYDAPWITVGGDSEAEVAFNLKALIDQGTFELVTQAAKSLQGQYGGQGAASDVLGAKLQQDATAPWDRTPPAQNPNAQPPAQPDPWQSTAPAPQWAQQQQPPAQAPGPQCAHGAMTFRTGEKNGRKWSAHFCPAPRGSVQCDPIFGRG